MHHRGHPTARHGTGLEGVVGRGQQASAWLGTHRMQGSAPGALAAPRLCWPANVPPRCLSPALLVNWSLLAPLTDISRMCLVPPLTQVRVKKIMSEQSKTRLIGPNCPGIIKPGAMAAGAGCLPRPQARVSRRLGLHTQAPRRHWLTHRRRGGAAFRGLRTANPTQVRAPCCRCCCRGVQDRHHARVYSHPRQDRHRVALG